MIFYNPAGLTYLDGHQVILTGSGIVATNKLKTSSATLPAALGGGAAGGPSSDSDVGQDAVIPALYAFWDVGPSLRIGFGLNSPFGLTTTYDPAWQGRYHSVTGKLVTVNLNPVVSYRVSDWLSIGGGLQVAYAKTRSSNAITTTTGAGFIDGTADDYGIGWSAGILLEPIAGTRIGVSYRSHVDHDLDGTATIYPGIGGPVNVGVSGDLDLPETVRVGMSHDLNTKVSLHFGAAWRRWSRFEEKRINFDEPVAVLAGLSSISTNKDWKNSWFVSIGATYRPVERWTLRAGVGFDETPVPDETRGPDVPGSNGTGVAFGATYQLTGSADVALSYTHVFANDARVNLVDPSTGNLSAEYDADYDILSVAVRLRY